MDHDDIRTLKIRLDKASFAFAKMTKRLDALERKVEEYRTLLVDLRGEDAVNFHESFDSGKK